MPSSTVCGLIQILMRAGWGEHLTLLDDVLQ